MCQESRKFLSRRAIYEIDIRRGYQYERRVRKHADRPGEVAENSSEKRVTAGESADCKAQMCPARKKPRRRSNRSASARRIQKWVHFKGIATEQKLVRRKSDSDWWSDLYSSGRPWTVNSYSENEGMTWPEFPVWVKLLLREAEQKQGIALPVASAAPRIAKQAMRRRPGAPCLTLPDRRGFDPASLFGKDSGGGGEKKE